MRLGLIWRSWRNQAVVWLLLIAIFAVVAVAVRTFLDYRAAAIELLLARDQKLTYLSAVRLRDELSKFVDSLTTIARTQAIYGGQPSVQRATLQQAQPIREGLFDGGVILLDHFGQVVAAEPNLGELLGEDWSDSEHFRRMLSSSSVYFSDVTDDRRTGSKIIIVSVPVVGEGGQFVGVLSGILRLGKSTISPLYATIVRLRVGQEGGNIYVLDRKGMILFASGAGRAGQPYHNTSLTKTVLGRQPGAVRTLNNEQKEIIASFAPVPGTEWTLVVEDDWRTITAATRRYMRLLIALLALGVILLLAGAYLLIRRLHDEDHSGALVENPLAVATQMKQMLLPDALPVVPGWDFSVHYRSHPAVEGDFYDLLLRRDGRLMLTVGSINATGLVATAMLAITRTVLRGAGRALLAPGEALARSNDFLCPELPPNSAVTCFFALLDPSTGNFEFVNAGSPIATYRNGEGVAPLASAGMPLGVQLGTAYSPAEITIAHGEAIVFYSPELVNVRNAQGETFGSLRLNELVQKIDAKGDQLIEAILMALDEFAGDSSKSLYSGVLLVLERRSTNVRHEQGNL